MSDNSRIQWTESTWPVTAGCTHISPGCDNCYAATLTSGRLKHLPAYAGLADHGKFNGQVRLLSERLDWPMKWRRPRLIFVDSMSDLFHEGVPDEYIALVFAVMAVTPQHTFQVLTKRHGRLRSLLNSSAFEPEVRAIARDMKYGGDRPDPRLDDRNYATWPLPNVWLGVSVEDQKWADIRIPALLDTPAAVRFLSCEPLLGPVRLGDGALNPWTCWWCKGRGELPGSNISAGTKSGPPQCWHCGGDGIDGRHIDWVIVGGESGAGARAMDPEWVRALRDECDGVAFFFKQWGQFVTEDQSPQDATMPSTATYLLGPDGPAFYRMQSKHDAGRELDGRTWDEMPDRQAVLP